MDESGSLGKLEAVVDKLISEYQSLQQERDRLLADLRQRDEQIMALQEENAQLSSERKDMHGRVSSMLGKLVEWEESQSSSHSTPQAADPAPSPVQEAPQAKLFTMEAG